MGKGSGRRPTAVDEQTFAANWERTFRKEKRMKRYYFSQQICVDARSEEDARAKLADMGLPPELDLVNVKDDVGMPLGAPRTLP